MSTRLHVTHSWGGGTGRWLGDFCKGDPGRRSLVLHSFTDRNHGGYRFELHEPAVGAAPLAAWTMAEPIATTALAHHEYRRILHGVLAGYGVRDVIVSSLLGHSLDALDTGLPTVVVLHDLYPFCPALFACFGAPCTGCPAERLQQCLHGNPLNVFWHNSTAQEWLTLRREYLARIDQPWLALAAPSQCIRERWVQLLPPMADRRWRRIPHGLDLAQFSPVDPRRPKQGDAKLRIVVPGRLAPHKGLQLLREVLPELLQMADLLLLGSGDFGKVFEGTAGVRIIPEYAQDGLAAEIARFAPDCALLMSVLPESFSYTLSEMFALGVPVLATRLGAFVERIDDGHTGVLYEPQPGPLLDCVRRVAADRQLLAAIASNVARLPRRGVEDMVCEYDALLAGLPTAEAAARSVPAPVAPASEAVLASVDAERAHIRNAMRGTLYLPDAIHIVFGVLPAGSKVAAARLIEAAAACTAARNDVCFYLFGVAEEEVDWGEHRAEAIVLLSRRRLFLPEGRVPRERMLVAADAYLAPVVTDPARGDEVAALRAGQLLLTFNRRPPARGADCDGQVALLAEGDVAASAAALSQWLDRPVEERAAIVARTRDALDRAAAGNTPAEVVAVVVTHQPRLEALGVLLAALSLQVDRIVLVDNLTSPPLAPWLKSHGPANLDCLFLDDNLGVAAAQNAGIARARALGAAYVLLSDQDSLPEPEMVERLLAALRERQDAGIRVAAVGPQYRDPRGAAGAFVRLRGLRYEHRACGGEAEVVEADHLIASGSLIPLAVLDDVGPLAEELFIDYVDTEWALRAARAGYRCFGVCAARMEHDRGGAPRHLLGRTVPMHDPVRHYYQNRNVVWLCRRDWLPLRWKLANGLRILRNLAVYALLPGPRLARCRMAALGIRDGLRGRMGRFAPGRLGQISRSASS